MFHFHNMTKPAQVSLFQQSVHAGSSSPLHDCVVWDFFLPGDFEYASETTRVEDVQLPLLSGAKSPGIAAVQQCAHDASSVYLDLGMFRRHFVGPYSLCHSRKGGSCLADALV